MVAGVLLLFELVSLLLKALQLMKSWQTRQGISQ